MNNQYFVGQPLLEMHASILLGIAGILFSPNQRPKTFACSSSVKSAVFFIFNDRDLNHVFVK